MTLDEYLKNKERRQDLRIKSRIQIGGLAFFAKKGHDKKSSPHRTKSPGLSRFQQFKLPRLGLPLLGAVLEKEFGIEVKIFFRRYRSTGKEVMEADSVGISTITTTAPVAFKFAQRIRRRATYPL